LWIFYCGEKEKEAMTLDKVFETHLQALPFVSVAGHVPCGDAWKWPERNFVEGD